MGIPSFYGWLVRKFPGITTSAHSSTSTSHGFDNFYLDMNSIIHQCFHPSIHHPQPTTFAQVFQAVADSIDNLFTIVQPNRLVYLAIDGVAPRAKMNQQRSRRFVAARDSQDSAAEEETLRRKFSAQGKSLPAVVEDSEVFDSNVITPGTEFMSHLSTELKRYVQSRLASHPDWKQLQVVVSDSSVPGEGEHKIMNFIRWLKYYSGNYDPETSHCLYGADADLILLSLATHEQNFCILREHGGDDNEEERLDFVHLPVLRDHLMKNMLIESPAFEVDYERVVDDFVFMCCLVGNDFLPYIPTLIINDGALDWMMTMYRTEFGRLGDYLTCHGQLNMQSVATFLKTIAAGEESFLTNKYQKKKKSRRYRRRRTYTGPPDPVEESNEPAVELPDIWEQNGAEADEPMETEVIQLEAEVPTSTSKTEESSAKRTNKQGKQRKKADTHLNETVEEVDEETLHNNLVELRMQVQSRLTRKFDRTRISQQKADKVELGLPGWKTRYYSVKLEVPESEEEILLEHRAGMVFKYVEGLAWILAYYYHGVCSWQWFYPYYYAPFASDFVGLASYNCQFNLGQPLKPLQQLLAVLPPESAHALPECYQKLMLEPESPVADFYPWEFAVDYTYVNKAWKGVVKLPFVDEDRLVTATEELEKLLTEEETQRNSFSSDVLLVHIPASI